MKLIICAVVGSVHLSTPGIKRWESCMCGAAAARWEDPEAGTVTVAADPAVRGWIRVLGLNNRLLMHAIASQDIAPEDFRRWHETATDAPGFLFDTSRCGCWAVPFTVGSTSDTRWATDEEMGQVIGLPSVPAAWRDGLTGAERAEYAERFTAGPGGHLTGTGLGELNVLPSEG